MLRILFLVLCLLGVVGLPGGGLLAAGDQYTVQAQKEDAAPSDAEDEEDEDDDQDLEAIGEGGKA